MNYQYELLESTCSYAKSLTLLQEGEAAGRGACKTFFSRGSFLLCISTANALVHMADEVTCRMKNHGYCYNFDIRIILTSLLIL